MYKEGKPHNEHLKYPMSTGHRFYPEWAPRPISLVLFEHMLNSAFSQTSEAWSSQDSIPWMPLINFLFPRPPFQVFNLGILFVIKPPFRAFTLNFSLFLFSFLAKIALSGFQFWQVFLLMASSIILLDYISIDRTRKLFPVYFGEYQCSSWECLLHNIRSLPVRWPFSTGSCRFWGILLNTSSPSWNWG